MSGCHVGRLADWLADWQVSVTNHQPPPPVNIVIVLRSKTCRVRKTGFLTYFRMHDCIKKKNLFLTPPSSPSHPIPWCRLFLVLSCRFLLPGTDRVWSMYRVAQLEWSDTVTCLRTYILYSRTVPYSMYRLLRTGGRCRVHAWAPPATTTRDRADRADRLPIATPPGGGRHFSSRSLFLLPFSSFCSEAKTLRSP